MNVKVFSIHKGHANIPIVDHPQLVISGESFIYHTRATFITKFYLLEHYMIGHHNNIAYFLINEWLLMLNNLMALINLYDLYNLIQMDIIKHIHVTKLLCIIIKRLFHINFSESLKVWTAIIVYHYFKLAKFATWRSLNTLLGL